MKDYEVTISETLQRTVQVRADNIAEAEAMVEERWRNSEYILGAEDFSEVNFHVAEHVRERELER